MNEAGEVDWVALPLFTASWGEDGYLHSIAHVGSATPKLVSRTDVDKTWSLLDFCSDAMARFRKGSREIYVREYFEIDEGPNKVTLGKRGSHMRELAKQVRTELTARRSEMQQLLMIASTQANLESRRKRVREEALQTARVVARRSLGDRARVVEAIEG